ncbi:hypothetical protein PAXINDRAFT_17270 [Paxillus involutus ATCC 200175]|uniref:Protein kinase domain-containing protein n=1 Tax=Paxillus involutus ATCC 200175 TaxID=664439 RepID=A0A0C9TPF3_PAXIN|nr:hypothetical protein PAXINDRAFT_17270 [Paxillus involutus ATCC 200175]
MRGGRSPSILRPRLEANEVMWGINAGQSSPPRDCPRNIVFFGPSGAGKSSTINLIAGFSVADTANDAKACTRASACYTTTIGNEAFNLWDTHALSGRGSKRKLKKFLRKRHQKREIDLLVYCIRGSRKNEALVKTYDTFCRITCRLAAPVVIVVTNLEREENMEDWWERNGSHVQSRGMEFNGHACITAIPNHPRENVSKKTLHELIARDYPWQAECDGSYFGSPVQRGQRVATPVVTGSEAQSSPGTRPYGKRKVSARLLGAPNWGGKQSPAGERSNGGADGLVEGRYKDLTAVVKRREQYASRSGGFGDIWECDLMTGETQRKVAVKAVRAQRTDTPNLATQEKKLRRELNVWARLQDKNVVELLGVVFGFGVLPSIVCPWFSNGSLSSYLPKHEAMDLSVRQGLLLNIASGLRYLHSRGVVHGDLHSGNVLVDEKGRACLTDFGLSMIIQDFPGTSYLKSGVCGAIRYADPELVRQVHVDRKVVHPTNPSDVYSFGGLMLYVLTGQQPYEGITEFVLCTTILRGDRPLLPVDDGGISSQHKSLIQRCWSLEETTRPSAEAIVTSLQEMPV